MSDDLQRKIERALEGLEGEARFDRVSRALYSTDASVYQIAPLGVVLPRSTRDLVRIVEIAGRLGCQPLLDRADTTQPATPRTTAS